MRTTRTASMLILSAVAAWTVGCSDDTGGHSSRKTGVVQALLQQMRDCGQLEAELKTDALLKMNAAIDAQLEAVKQWGGNGWGGAYATPGASDASGGETGAPADPAPNGGQRADDFSQTNTQVAGVDEADFVKNDGKYIYLLHGQSFLVVNAYPASELAQTSSFGIEGNPLEMYVTDDGDIVVYSTVDGAPVYEAAGLEPRSTYNEWGGWGYPGVPVGAAEPAYPGSYVANPLTKITVLRLEGTEPQLVAEQYFEGGYTSSRRVGQYVRTVLQGSSYGPALQYWPESLNYDATPAQTIAALQQLRGANAAKIQNSTLADWLPYQFTRTAGGVQATLPMCQEFYMPTAGSTTYGLTQIESLDLANPTATPRGASIIGQVNTVYSSESTMVLAAHAWLDPWTAGGMPVPSSGGDDVAVAQPAPTEPAPSQGEATGTASSPLTAMISTTYTHLHTFDLATNPAVPVYRASGTVAGGVLNQFSIDEHKGHIRVATTDDQIDPSTYESARVNHVFVLAEQQSNLLVTGSVQGLAPGERIYSVRFMGDKGYVVTFRQVDPLFAIDLSDPAEPAVLGELKIPGFSEYMHPLDDGHLLTIGQDEDRSLALQIFDVTDPVHPAQLHKYSFSGNEWGYSEAQSNHKAFTYYPSRKLLAFPFVGYGDYDNGMRSSLELFHIDLVDGIVKLGSVDHTALFASSPQGYCGGYYGVDVRRGIFMDDFVYSISYGGIVANDVNALTTPIATLPLPAPANEAYGCYPAD